MTNSEQALAKAKEAYDLLANGDVPEHMKGLKLLDEARILDAEAVMRFEQEIEQYKMLTITATHPTTTIYLADEQDNLVQREVGFMQTSIAPGVYLIHFDDKNELRRIDLTQDMEIKQ